MCVPDKILTQTSGVKVCRGASWVDHLLLHQLDALAVLRNVDVPAEAILDVARHRVRRFGFAVGQEGAAGNAGLHPF